MDHRHVSPALQRLWVDEVLHLHSLWHRGPPQQNPSPNPSLRPTSSAAFKMESKKKKKKKNKKKREKRDTAPLEEPQPSSGKEWPFAPEAEPKPFPEKWSDVAPPPKPRAAAEEAGHAAAILMQQGGLRACEKFFSKKDDEDDDEDEEDEEDEEDGMDVEEAGQLEELEFFLGIFEKDRALREYYEKNCEKGEFYCLVCEGIGVKKGKRFGSCVGLVQHSNSISKTKRRRAHRAFARAICRVLGWNMERLPSIVLDSGVSLSQSLAKASDAKEIPQKKDSGEVFENKEETCKEVVEKVGTDYDVVESVETREIEDLPSENLQEQDCADLIDCMQIREIMGTQNEEDVTDIRELADESAKGLDTDSVNLREELLEHYKTRNS
ncbi:uncharacterized protein [Typha angustifolia]|uniref:uncharacterized protein isoform X2 n=1 Tax=Typha angustifolia TaxID=59011 RepID=UPI003C2EDC6F